MTEQELSINVSASSRSLKQLQYLVALRRFGHFGKAAGACFVTQSTLSAGLRELETLLGVTLVERTRRLVRITALGEKMADKAVPAFFAKPKSLESWRALRDNHARRTSGMGVIPTIAPFLLPAMLPRLRTEWPDLKLYLREETSTAACEALHRGQLDCVLLALPFNCGEIESAPVFDDALFIAFPPGEAPPQGSVNAASIDENRLLHFWRTGIASKTMRSPPATDPKIRAHASMMGTSLPTLVQMVNNGLGLTFIPGMVFSTGLLRGTKVNARAPQIRSWRS